MDYPRILTQRVNLKLKKFSKKQNKKIVLSLKKINLRAKPKKNKQKKKPQNKHQKNDSPSGLYSP